MKRTLKTFDEIKKCVSSFTETVKKTNDQSRKAASETVVMQIGTKCSFKDLKEKELQNLYPTLLGLAEYIPFSAKQTLLGYIFRERKDISLVHLQEVLTMWQPANAVIIDLLKKVQMSDEKTEAIHDFLLKNDRGILWQWAVAEATIRNKVSMEKMMESAKNFPVHLVQTEKMTA